MMIRSQKYALVTFIIRKENSAVTSMLFAPDSIVDEKVPSSRTASIVNLSPEDKVYRFDVVCVISLRPFTPMVSGGRSKQG